MFEDVFVSEFFTEPNKAKFVEQEHFVYIYSSGLSLEDLKMFSSSEVYVSETNFSYSEFVY